MHKPDFDRIGRCIYCGATDGLTDEHVIPRSLNGTMVLRDASCRACQDITSRFEGQVTQGMWDPIRTKLGFRTYNSKRREKASIIDVRVRSRDGSERVQKMPIAHRTVSFAVIDLPPAGILVGRPPDEDVEIGVRFIATGGADDSKWFRQGDMSEHRVLYNPVAMCRMLAKIAHCFAVSTFGQAGYTALLPALILGASLSQPTHLVGGLAGDRGGEVRRISIVLEQRGSVEYIVVLIRLPLPEASPYEVVAGVVTDHDAVKAARLARSTAQGWYGVAARLPLSLPLARQRAAIRLRPVVVLITPIIPRGMPAFAGLEAPLPI